MQLYINIISLWLIVRCKQLAYFWERFLSTLRTRSSVWTKKGAWKVVEPSDIKSFQYYFSTYVCTLHYFSKDSEILFSLESNSRGTSQDIILRSTYRNEFIGEGHSRFRSHKPQSPFKFNFWIKQSDWLILGQSADYLLNPKV